MRLIVTIFVDTRFANHTVDISLECPLRHKCLILRHLPHTLFVLCSTHLVTHANQASQHSIVEAQPLFVIASTAKRKLSKLTHRDGNYVLLIIP